MSEELKVGEVSEVSEVLSSICEEVENLAMTSSENMHLWEFKRQDVGNNDNADSFDSFEEFLKSEEKVKEKYRNPVHFHWEENSDLFSEEEEIGTFDTCDVLQLDYLGNYSLWIKVNKDEEGIITKYLAECDLVQT